MQRTSCLRYSTLGCLAGFLLLWQSAGIGYAEPVPPAGSALYAFGRHLFALGEYYRAITELKRFSLLFPQHPHYPAAQVLIGLAFQEDGEYAMAWAHFRQVRDTVADAERLAAFKLGELRVAQRQYPQAIQHFQHFLRTFSNDPLAGRTTYLLGLSWALNDRAELAKQALQLVPPDDPLAAQALALQQELEIPCPSPPKSPTTAGILAGILPGAGHLYVGKPWHGLTAFLLNGLFISGAIFAYKAGLEATAVILLYFETGWYIGNIKSAVEGAHEVNQHQQEMFADHLRTTYAPSALSLQQLSAPGLGLRFRF